MKPWTLEQDTLLREIYGTAPVDEIAICLGKTVPSVYLHAKKLGLRKQLEWPPEEDRLLRQIYPAGTKQQILARIKKPWLCIYHRATKILHLVRDREIVKQEMREGGAKAPPREDFWSKNEEALLRKVYPNETRENMVKQFPGRTFRSIREHARWIGLTRSDESVKQDRNRHNSTTIKAKYGVEWSTQLADMQKKTKQTNLQRRGVEYPTQSAEVKKKIYETNRIHDSFSTSGEEESFFGCLRMFDQAIERHKKHPEIGHVIDYYLPKFDLWVQYDGVYWHGKIGREKETARSVHIKHTMENDKLQNEKILNLVRFWSDEVMAAKAAGSLPDFVKTKLREKCGPSIDQDQTCHQFKKKLQWVKEDIANLPFDHTALKASDFIIDAEPYTKEITGFIEKYEWLGSIGVIPKWCFTARYQKMLAGVVLINEPTAYSRLLGPETPRYEALIQRGATASWTPKNLGSRLIMFSCRWMAINTDKRLFVAYGDPAANEIGTIYQACNFDYLGKDFGERVQYLHPLMGREPFSPHALKRTSALKRWCAQNGTPFQKKWLKENGFKNLSEIPEEVKTEWRNWIRKIVSESQKVRVATKHKYAIVIGRDNAEYKRLRNLRTYQPIQYPKRTQ